jgi:hypothetical protein
MLTKALDKLVAMVDADPFVFCDRESIIALQRQRALLAEFHSRVVATASQRR